MLFDAFIPAAYRDNTGGRWKAQDAESWLVFLARHLERTIDAPNLAWWQLPPALPGFAFANGIMCGLAFGVVFGVIFDVVFKTIAGAAVTGVVAGALIAASVTRVKLPTPVWGISRSHQVAAPSLPRSRPG